MSELDTKEFYDNQMDAEGIVLSKDQIPASSPVPAPEDTLTGWMAIPLEHTRSCQHWNDDGCTCALEIRIAAWNWMELHNAWRKRAEEAEAELNRLRAVPAPENIELTEALDAFARELSIVKLEHIYAVPRVASARADLVALWNRERDHRDFLYAEAAKQEERIASLSSQLERVKADSLTEEEARKCAFWIDECGEGSPENYALVAKLRRRLSSGDSE